MSEPQVTIAVVSWNTRELLERCLESMRAPVEAGLARVRVVDNASSDGSAELVRERFGWAELIEGERNLGFGAAVNAGRGRHAPGWPRRTPTSSCPRGRSRPCSPPVASHQGRACWRPR